MNIGSFKELVQNMKEANKRIGLLEKIGGFKRTTEVKPNSVVQILVKVPIDVAGSKIYDWVYTQTWFAKLGPEEQELIKDAYWGEEIGNVKVVGVYEPQPGLERITNVPTFGK